MSDVEQDMRARWTPSKEQDAEAQAHLLATGDKLVMTAHLLVGKHHGFWDMDSIEVEPLPGLFTDRNQASEALEEAGLRRHQETGKPVSGAYVYHRPVRQGDPDVPRTADGTAWLTSWSVFEDILCVFPVPTWSSRHPSNTKS